MKANIVRIGNSRGIRIPKPVLEQCGISQQVEMTVRGTELILASARKTRSGWDAAFAAMARQGDDRPLIEAKTDWDETEWRW